MGSFIINPFIFAAASPIPTTGLKIWLKGDVGVIESTGAVDTWQDQSGNGNDLTQTANSTFRPTYSTDHLVFDGSNDFLSATTQCTFGHYFIVMTPSGTQSYGSLIATATRHCLIRDAATNNLYTSAVKIFGGLANVRKNESTSTNLGTTKAQWNDKGTAETNLRLLLGKDINGGGAAAGDIYEVIVYDAALSDTDRNTVEDYLQAKYGL
jgi:hypothetical protein